MDANIGNTNVEEARGYMQKFHSAQSNTRPGHKDPKLIQFLSSQWLHSPLERLRFGFQSSLVYSAQLRLSKKNPNPAGTPYSLRSLARIISYVTRHFPLGTRMGEERGWRV